MAEKFGIEIETGWGTVPPRQQWNTVIQALKNAGLAVEDLRHTHIGFSQTDWVVKRDGSLGDNGEEGFEIASPPLDFTNEEDRAQVDRVLIALQVAGCVPIEAGSIHVHVQAVDLSAKEVAAILRFCWKFEDVLWRIASSGWRTIRPGAMRQLGGYAQLLTNDMVRRMTKVRSNTALIRVWAGNDMVDDPEPAGERYQMVNLNPWWSKGTVEFRMFNASLNPERVQAYIAICIAIVRDARNGQSRSTNKNYPLGTMKKHPEMAQKMFLRFQQVMTCASADSSKSTMRQRPPIMSKLDWKRVRFCWQESVPQERKI